MCKIGVFGFTVLFHFVRKVWHAFYFHVSWENIKVQLHCLLQNKKPGFSQFCL